jgi:hypothetical protein
MNLCVTFPTNQDYVQPISNVEKKKRKIETISTEEPDNKKTSPSTVQKTSSEKPKHKINSFNPSWQIFGLPAENFHFW